MAKRYTLYWSYLVMYENCPQRVLWKKGWGEIDLGRGPGRGKQIPPVRRSEHHALAGTVVQYAIERIYKDELWRDPGELKTLIRANIDRCFQIEMSRRYIEWDRVNMEDLRQKCTQTAIRYIATMKHHSLLGDWNATEKDLLCWINQYNPIGGRPDLCFKRSDTGITILDGKNTDIAEHGLKYLDPDQLRWYAMCWYLAYNRSMPDRIGWILYQREDPAEAIEWIDFDLNDLKDMRIRALEVRENMFKEKFEARPVATYCPMCDFESVCPERQAQKKKQAFEKASVSREKLPDVFKHSEGLISFEFGDTD